MTRLCERGRLPLHIFIKVLSSKWDTYHFFNLDSPLGASAKFQILWWAKSDFPTNNQHRSLVWWCPNTQQGDSLSGGRCPHTSQAQAHQKGRKSSSPACKKSTIGWYFRWLQHQALRHQHNNLYIYTNSYTTKTKWGDEHHFESPLVQQTTGWLSYCGLPMIAWYSCTQIKVGLLCLKTQWQEGRQVGCSSNIF